MAAKQANPRYRVTVPLADESVNAWLELQDDISASVRVAIREYIERNGFTDATCHPVSQQPKRGRPSKQIEGETSTLLQFDDEPETDDDEPIGYQIAQAAGTATIDEAGTAKPIDEPQGHIDINDLFSKTR